MKIAATISMASRLIREAWVRKPLTLGAKGEAAAAKFLRKKGYILIGTNVRTSMGEIDLVAVDGRTVVFVEVKTRESDDKGHPAEAVDQRKQDKLTRLGIAYLRRNNLLENAARFDIVAVTWPNGAKKPLIEHFENAFEPSIPFQMFV